MARIAISICLFLSLTRVDGTSQSSFSSSGAGPKESLVIDDFISDINLGGLALSQDGSRAVYHAGPKYRSGPHSGSSLWIADTSVDDSSQQITSGPFHDHSAQFLGSRSDIIYFLSDRQGPGKASDIFCITVPPTPKDAVGTSPVAITDTQTDGKITEFIISPDGLLMAYLSVEAEKDEQISAPEVWSERTGLSRLFILDLTDPVPARHKVLATSDEHIASFSWSPDSTRIIYRTARHPALENLYLPVSEYIISLSENISTFVHHLPQSPNGPPLWADNGTLLYHRGYATHRLSSSGALWGLKQLEDKRNLGKIAYGEVDDLVRMIGVGVDTRIAVEIASGLDTRVEVLDLSSPSVDSWVAFQTNLDAITRGSWDVKLSSPERGEYTFVALRSSGIKGEPEELWTGFTTEGKEGTLIKRLSSHRRWVAGKELPIMKPFYWSSVDGTDMQGLAVFPPRRRWNMPTIIVPHGGPYSRDVAGLIFGYLPLHTFLASRGYLVLMPNYRGSSGRGDAFAGIANGGMGTFDWADTQTMLAEAVSRGLADPSRLGIAGHSQGGFLTAWGITRPENHLKAAVMIDGVSDWGSLVLSSDMPEFEADLAGGAPWNGSTTHFLSGSPVRDAANVKAHLLIMHGKDDARTPLSQAVGFFRGVLRASEYPERAEMVLYPNEGHVFEEKEHARDVMERVLAHFTQFL